jgi:hypothetical protein
MLKLPDAEIALEVPKFSLQQSGSRRETVRNECRRLTQAPGRATQGRAAQID